MWYLKNYDELTKKIVRFTKPESKPLLLARVELSEID